MSILQIVFWDVQHGNAAYVKTPSDKHFAIDAGVGSFDNSDETFSPLGHLIDNHGLTQLDGAIITHPHTDHVNDINKLRSLQPKVLRRPTHLTDEEIFGGNPDFDKSTVSKFLAMSKSYNNPVPPGTSPFLADNNGGVEFRSFYPQNCNRKNLNNHSIVTVVSFEGVKILIPGDNESESWDELLQNREFVKQIAGTHVLLAPHHGRQAGFSTRLFAHFKPKLVVVSDGSVTDTSARDRYRSHAEGWTIQKKDGSTEERRCLTTASDGTIVIRIFRDSEGTPRIGVSTTR